MVRQFKPWPSQVEAPKIKSTLLIVMGIQRILKTQKASIDEKAGRTRWEFTVYVFLVPFFFKYSASAFMLSVLI